MVEKILTDQGVNFESELFQQLCALLKTNKLRTSTYHAMGNGITERLNKNIKPMLAKFVNDTHTDWDLFLPMAVSAYNTSLHSSIGMTPYEAQCGRKPVLVADVILNNNQDTSNNLDEFIKRLRQNAARISDTIEEHARAARAKQEHSYNRFLQFKHQYEVDDLVKITNYNSQAGLSKAFLPKFKGPYKIVKKLNDLTYVLQSLINTKDEVVHYNRMAPFHEIVNSIPLVRHSGEAPMSVQDSLRIVETPNSSARVSDEFQFVKSIFSSLLLKKKLKKLVNEASIDDVNAFTEFNENNEAAKDAVSTSTSAATIANDDVIEVVPETSIDELSGIIDTHLATGSVSICPTYCSCQRNPTPGPANQNGKATIQCHTCSKLVEKSHGLRAHINFSKNGCSDQK